MANDQEITTLAAPGLGEPWWRTPWVALPILAAAGGLGIAAATVALRRRPDGPPIMPEWCHPDVGELGGQLEGVDYVELRTGATTKDERLPMVVALHSRGMTAERIAEFAAGLPGKVRVIAPVGFEEAGLGRAWTASSPNDAQYSAELQDTAAALVPFIEAVQQCRPTVGKPIVAGYSGGADLAYALAAEAQPDVVSAAVGAAGWILPGLDPIAVPTHVVHGRDDTAVPYGRTADEVAARIGTQPVKLHGMEGVGHSFKGALQLRWLETMAKALPAQTSA